MKYAAAIFVILFLGTTVFIAPFLRFKEKEEELAKLTPAGSNTPYPKLLKDWTDTKTALETEKGDRKKTEELAEHYRKQGIDWLTSATNTTTIIPILDEAIAVVTKERDAMKNNPSSSIAELAQRDEDLNKLQAGRALAEMKERCGHYNAYLRYVALAYQEKFAASISKCGGTVEPFPQLPAVDWWAVCDDRKTNIISTNCGVRFVYEFWARAGGLFHPTTTIEIQGKKAKPARARFILSSEPSFHSRLFLGTNDFGFRIEKVQGLLDNTNCIKDVDYILNKLLESQKEEFQ